jgi:fructose-1,6-bisphosphatase II
MFFPGAAVYMDKIACGPEAADAVDIEAPPAENVKRVAKAKGVQPSEITVVVLERDRHQDLIAELRAIEAKVLLITDGDVAPAIAAAQPGTGVDLLMGIGGTPEGVLSDSELKCVGVVLLGKLWPRNDEERRALARRALHEGRRDHGLDRHALPFRHGAPHRGAARLRQARGALRRPLPPRRRALILL